MTKEEINLVSLAIGSGERMLDRALVSDDPQEKDSLIIRARLHIQNALGYIDLCQAGES